MTDPTGSLKFINSVPYFFAHGDWYHNGSNISAVEDVQDFKSTIACWDWTEEAKGACLGFRFNSS